MNALNPSAFLNRSISDKTHIHNYGTLYDMVFCAMMFANKKPLKVIEVGVSEIANSYKSKRGYAHGSGHAFSQIPYIEKFVGIDLKPMKLEFSDRGVFIQANAYTQETIDKIKQYGKFHIIIDDGSHRLDDIVTFFQLYESLLDNNGIMICEDVKSEYVEDIMERLNPGLDTFVVNTRKNNTTFDEIQRRCIVRIKISDDVFMGGSE